MGSIFTKKKPFNVVYLEDDRLHYDLMRFILNKYVKHRINIIWVKTNKEAYETIKNNNINLLIADRLLQGEYGDSLVNKVIEDRLLHYSQIIYLSGLNDDENVKEIIKRFSEGRLKYLKEPTKEKK